jgi:hypothetical protein
LTVGNALRRVLLSALEGYAITSRVRIEVAHGKRTKTPTTFFVTVGETVKHPNEEANDAKSCLCLCAFFRCAAHRDHGQNVATQFSQLCGRNMQKQRVPAQVEPKHNTQTSTVLLLPAGRRSCRSAMPTPLQMRGVHRRLQRSRAMCASAFHRVLRGVSPKTRYSGRHVAPDLARFSVADSAPGRHLTATRCTHHTYTHRMKCESPAWLTQGVGLVLRRVARWELHNRSLHRCNSFEAACSSYYCWQMRALPCSATPSANTQPRTTLPSGNRPRRRWWPDTRSTPRLWGPARPSYTKAHPRYEGCPRGGTHRPSCNIPRRVPLVSCPPQDGATLLYPCCWVWFRHGLERHLNSDSDAFQASV